MKIRRVVASRTRLAPVLAVITLLATASSPAVVAQSRERVDLDAIYKIKEEGFQRSQVMDIASYLTDVHGPRLTGSPSIQAAAEWSRKTLAAWGLAGVALEPWGPFGRGWSNERFAAHVTAPQPYALIGYPKAWTPGTSGTVTGEAVAAVIGDEKDFEAWRGKLKGRFVLTAPLRDVRASFEPLATRYTEQELATLSRQPDPSQRGPRRGDFQTQQAFQRRRMEFFLSEGVLALVEPGRGDGGTVFVQSGGSRNPKDPPAPPQVVLAVEHYGRIFRTLERKVPVTIEMTVQNTFHDANLNSFNIVAEIPGTDKKDELVMLGAHFDAWHSGTGATDNAAGSAVMMEAVRILKAANLPLRRTVRLALWTGEEQGLLGSREYVKQHFADRETMTPKPDHGKLSAYFNVDNGTGAIRGVYLQGNEAVAPIFAAWMEPFRNLGMTTLTIRNTGGTDHLSYDAVGLPGFQFIQDEVEYDTRTHHSNMDVYERIQTADMMQNAVIVASFVYHAANRDEKLPRKPLPKPQPAQRTTSQP